MLKIDTDSIRKNKIELLDCQVEIVLYGLELFCNNLRYICPKSNKYLTTYEELQITLIIDTYNQILSQFNNSKETNKIIPIEKNLKKFA